MSGYRNPGVLDSSGRSEPVDHGTMVRSTAPSPGVVGAAHPMGSRTHGATADESAGAPYAAGLSSLVRIPIPGTNGLCIEFSPRGTRGKGIPLSGSTSTLFFQDPSGKRHLRLDYGPNPRANGIDYHWNQSGTNSVFKISNHAPAGKVGKVAYSAAKYFRYAGRVVVVAGAVADVVSIVQADRPLRQSAKVVAGWASARAGCAAVGAAGAWAGTLALPFGTVIGGVGGCIVGGVGGYFAGSAVAGDLYDWAEGTQFTPLQEAAGP